METTLLSPGSWAGYELIDSGAYEKLERFGRYVVRRPEPQAIWDKSLTDEEWERLSDASFLRDRRNDERGEWVCRSSMPDRWFVDYQYKGMKLRMRLGLTSFKHVGIFPEQAENWNYLYDFLKGRVNGAGHGKVNGIQPASAGNAAGARAGVVPVAPAAGGAPEVLNLFAYTGGATLAARSAGAVVTHVDSVKQVVSWARENMEASGLDGVRWIVDDALKFVRREVKRGRQYDAIILDPPAYGRGPDGEKWVLEENLGEMLSLCAQLLKPAGSCLVLNLYSMGLSALLAHGIVRQRFGVARSEQFGELYFTDRGGKALPLGVYCRMQR